MIPFTGFSPDTDPTVQGVITDCANLVPTLKGYAGAPSGADVGMDTLADAALSAALTIDLSSVGRLIVGSATKLYEKAGVVWTDVSRNISSVITISIASPAVVDWGNHGLVAGTAVVFTTTGALPTGVTAATTYYVISDGLATATFQFSATLGGSAVNTSGSQSGIHTATRTDAAYHASVNYPWRFAQFGNTTLATNHYDVIQASNSGKFSDLVSPQVHVMCVVSGFVMAAHTFDAIYGHEHDRWWCSAYLDYTDWTPAISTQCTTGRLVDTPGRIRGIKALGYDVVAYKDRSMYLGRYVGPPGVWDFTLLPGSAGAVSQEAIADIETAHVFIGENDIYLFDGSLPKPIGAPIREWFFADLDIDRRNTIVHSHDRHNSFVYFYYPRLGDTAKLSGCIVYNYKTNQWGLAHRSIGCVVEYILGGFTWDTLPFAIWDVWPGVKYDSPFWQKTVRYVAFMGTDGKVYAMTGESDTSSLTTGDYGVENQNSLLSRVTLRYLNRPESATLTNYYQDIHGGAWKTDHTVPEFNGRFDLFRSAPWHKAKFNFVGDVEFTAINADFKPDGEI